MPPVKKSSLPSKSIKKGGSPKDRTKKTATNPQKQRRNALEALYRQLWHLVPDQVRDPVTGALWSKEAMERHHPAGRRKDAFLYTIMLTPATHRLIHDAPDLGERWGLLWPGRNSKVFTLEDAKKLVSLRPVYMTYPEDLFKTVTS